MSRLEVERLRAFRKSLGINQTDFAQSLGIKQGSYSDIERGKVGISGDIMKILVRKYHLNLLWLYEGIPPKQIPLGKPIEIETPGLAALLEFTGNQEQATGLIDQLLAQLPEEQGTIKNALKQEYNKLISENTSLKNKLIKLYETQDQTVGMLNRLMQLSNTNT